MGATPIPVSAVPKPGAHPVPPVRNGRRPSISFEVMPPRNPDAAPRFWATVEALVAVHPDFISVTYGAGGGDRDTACEVVHRLRRSTPVLPVAHLTCVGHTRDHLREVVGEFLDSGVRSFLALRGDPPAAPPEAPPNAPSAASPATPSAASAPPTAGPAPDTLSSSIELVTLLRAVERERIEANPTQALRAAAHPMTVAVATFVDGNPIAGTTRRQEVERLLIKQAAGADYAITQLFYRAEDYATFRDEARSAGVTIPILAGLLPATDPDRLRRTHALTGVAAPDELLKKLDAAPAAQRASIGADATAQLARDVLALGSPGIHLYSFNQAGPSLDVLARLGLQD